MTRRDILGLLGISIGTAGLLAGNSTRLFALGGNAAAQGRGHGNEDEDQDHGDHGRGHGHGREKNDRRRFDDRNREAAHVYYEHHKHDRDFDEDRRWRPEYESRLREGYVLDPDFRRMCRPCPPGLLRDLPPCPRGYRYFLLGDHVVMVDTGYRVVDLIHMELNIHL